MIYSLCRLLSINHRVLEFTRQTRQCLLMVSFFLCVFSILGLVAFDTFLLSAFGHMTYAFPISLAISLVIGFFQYISYRQLICDILFTQNYLRIILLALLTSLINILFWLPSSLSFEFNVEMIHLSTFEWLTLNKYLLFLIGIVGMTVAAFSVIPLFALYKSARLHRIITLASILNQ